MGEVINHRIMIEGATLTELRQLMDERGGVLHFIRSDSPDFIGFGECYFSEIRPGAIKGWKRHRAQTQTLAVPIGRVRFVIYDDRPISGTRGKLELFDLGRPDAYLRLRIPPGLWYSFACISRQSALLVNCADLPHDPNECEIQPIKSPTIPYSWNEEERLELL